MNVLVRGDVNLPLGLPVSGVREKKLIRENVRITVTDVPIDSGNFEDEVPAVVFSNDIADISKVKERYSMECFEVFSLPYF